MKVEDCIFNVKRRSTGGCIDLACVFANRFGFELAKLTLIFAIPSMIAGFLILKWFPEGTLAVLMVVAFMSALFSGAHVAGMGPQVFGVPFNARVALRKLANRGGVYTFWCLAVRAMQLVSSFCFFAPILFVTAWLGHAAEVVFLEQAPAKSIGSRMNALCQGGGFGSSFGRIVIVTLYASIVIFGLFLGAHLLSNMLFNQPIIADHVMHPFFSLAEFRSWTLVDPWAVTVIQGCFWIVFPITRLAWFFFYLDQRIRSECWDLDVAVQVEAKRLEQPA